MLLDLFPYRWTLYQWFVNIFYLRSNFRWGNSGVVLFIFLTCSVCVYVVICPWKDALCRSTVRPPDGLYLLPAAEGGCGPLSSKIDLLRIFSRKKLGGASGTSLKCALVQLVETQALTRTATVSSSDQMRPKETVQTSPVKSGCYCSITNPT